MQILYKRTIEVFIFVILCSLPFFSCKKFVEVPIPSTSTGAELVFSNDKSAIAALTAIYTRMSQNGINNGITGVSLFSGLSADELMVFNGNNSTALLSYFKNALTSTSAGTNNPWSDSYYIIFMANTAIEGISSSSSLTPLIKKHLLGEAKFLRAFCYFYLTNLYGDVPLTLTSNYKFNSNLPRTAKQKVYDQIITDLKEAQNNLSDDYLDVTLMETSAERTVPNKWTATALLARVYLYIGDNVNAIIQATEVINNTDLYDLVDLNSIFLKNSLEAIWQIQSVSNVFTNTSEARVFILPANGPNAITYPIYLFKDFVENGFESLDLRRNQWIKSVIQNGNTYYYPVKYKINGFFAPVGEYSVVFRLGEQYLIRAEAFAQNGKLEDAKKDIDRIRARAGINSITITTKEDMLDTVFIERKRELFTEWGHRWLDLKRSGKINNMMPNASQVKGGTWESFKQLYPIPQIDIERNPALADQQNLGYN